MSDHNIIEVTIILRDSNGQITNTEDGAEVGVADVRQLNFHDKNMSWDEIQECIKEMPWTELF